MFRYTVFGDNTGQFSLHNTPSEASNLSGVSSELVSTYDWATKYLLQPWFNGTYAIRADSTLSGTYTCPATGEVTNFTLPTATTVSCITGAFKEVYSTDDIRLSYINPCTPVATATGQTMDCPSSGNPTITFNAAPNKPIGQCTGVINPSSGNIPASVAWSAKNVSSGGGTLTYSWSFDGGSSPSSATGQNVTTNYGTAGTKTATLTITSSEGFPSDPINCIVTATASAPPPLVGQCTKVTATNTPFIGTSVQWQASSVSGGTAPYTYSWAGTDQASPVGGNPYTKTYSTVGVKTPTVTVTSSDGQVINPICPSVTVSPNLNVVVVGAGTLNSVSSFNLAGESPDGNIAGCTNTGGAACNHQYGPNAVVGLRATIPPNTLLSWSGCDTLPNGAGGSGCSLTMSGDRTVTATFTAVGVIDLTLSCPASVTYGSGPALSWNTSGNPDSCTASGGWAGSKTANATNGPQTQTGITSNTTYTLTCNKAGTSSVSKSCTVPVGPSQPVISVSKGWCGGRTYVAITTPSQGFTSYTLNRYSISQGWVTVKTGMTAANFPPPYGYVDPTLTPPLALNTNYKYQLQALGSGGLSSYSDYTLPASSAISSDSCAVNLLVK